MSRLRSFATLTAVVAAVYLLAVYAPRAVGDDSPPAQTATGMVPPGDPITQQVVVTVPAKVEGRDVHWWHGRAVHNRRVIIKLRRRLRALHATRRLQSAETVPQVICSVFGSYCGQAQRVAWCESRYDVHAVNGQYEGLFQESAAVRARYGFGWDAWTQARSAFGYFRDSGYSWSPWTCGGAA